METRYAQTFKIETYVPWLIFAITLLLRFYYIPYRDISLDEPFTIFNAQKSIPEILKMTLTTDSTPPVFMILLHFWIKLFGIGQMAVRSLPAVISSLAPVFIYFLGKKLTNFWGGLIASAMAVVSFYQFFLGVETRAYPLLFLATSAALYFLFSALKTPERKIFLAGLLTSNILVVYSHYFGWFVIFMEFIVAIISFRNRLALKGILITTVLTALAFGPMVRIFVETFLTSKDHTWVRAPSAGEFWNQLVYIMNGRIAIYSSFVLFTTGIIFYNISNRKKKFPGFVALLFIFWFIPYTLMFFVSSKVPMFLDRYVMFNSIGLYLFTGTFLGYFFEKRAFLIPLSGIILITGMIIGLDLHSKDYGLREVKKAVAYVKKSRKEKATILIHPQWTHIGFMYYYNSDIFRKFSKYDSLLQANSIFPVWGIKDAKEKIENCRGGQIIYYQDGSQPVDPDNTIFHYLDSISVRTDSVFFPQSFYISAFDLKSDSVNVANQDTGNFH